MDKRKFFSILAIGALALAAVGAFAIQSVNAQATTPTPADPDSTVPNEQAPGKQWLFGGLKGERGGYTQEDLAAALGITVEQLQAAQDTAQAEALEQAVSQGLITQEQADRITENGGRGLPFLRKGLAGSAIDYNALLADALGISTDDLQAARSEAFVTAIDRAVEQGTITQERADLMKGRQALALDEKFQSSLQSAYEAAIAQAVEDGVITQAQADLILENSQQKGFPGWGGAFGSPHGFGGRGRHGFPGGALPDLPAEPAAPAAPATDGA
jgi:ribosomal protein S20